MTDLENYRTQHKLRLSYMPWLYFSLKQHHLSWARPWQQSWQHYLQEMETVVINGNCFIAPEARLFAQRGRPIILEDGAWIAADSVLHGPVTLGRCASINHHSTLDGGRAGIMIGDHSRIACYARIFAFNHGQKKEFPIAAQPTVSQGINIGKNVWVGAEVKIADGVTLGDGCIVGMGSVVTRSYAANAKIAGNPARRIGDR